MPQETPKRDLLSRVIKAVSSSDWSPVQWDATVRAIGREDITPSEVREASHSLLDWYYPVRELELSKEDQEILKVNAEELSDAGKRKKLLRKQRKAMKRARAKSKFSSKVSGEWVELMTETIESTSPARAADKLAFVSCLAESLTINEMVDLLKRITPYKTSFKMPRNPAELRDEIKSNEDLPVNDKLEIYEYLYAVSHIPFGNNLKKCQEVNRKRSSGKTKKWMQYVGTTLSEDDFLKVLGCKVKLVDVLDVPDLRWISRKKKSDAGTNDLLLAAIDVSYLFKPEIDLSKPNNSLASISFLLKRRNIKGITWDTLDELLEEYKRLEAEFNVPTMLVLMEEPIDNCTVTTIITEAQLKANKDYMGNCTGGLQQRLTNSEQTLFIVEDSDGLRHNVHYNKDGKMLQSKARYNNQSSAEVKSIHSKLGELVKESRQTT